MNVVNRTGILISTAYQTLNNPMTQEVDIAEKVIRGHLDNDKLFAMLYRPDNEKEWMTSDDELLKANPLAQESQEIFDFLVTQRSQAIIIPERRGNFLTKHMNIFINGDQEEAFIKEQDLSDCIVDSIDWKGRDVYLGLDLSKTDDNTSVSMSAYDEYSRKIYAKSWAFYPKAFELAKSQVEKLDYNKMHENGWAFPTGNKIIDYGDIETFIMGIEDTYGVHVKGIGYDNWNSSSTISKLSNADFNCVEIDQHTRGLYPATKLLKEKIMNGDFEMETNDLFKLNFLNAKVVYDNNMSYYLNKKKSNGKIDMVAALVDSMALWQMEIADEDRDNTRLISVF